MYGKGGNVSLKRDKSDRVLLNSSGLDALRAYGHSLCALGRINPHPLEVGKPDPIGLVLGMGYVMTGLRALSTNLALSRHVL